jgi:hypothetical protein
MKKALLFIAMLLAGLLIGGKFDQETKDLEQQEINSTK